MADDHPTQSENARISERSIPVASRSETVALGLGLGYSFECCAMLDALRLPGPTCQLVMVMLVVGFGCSGLLARLRHSNYSKRMKRKSLSILFAAVLFLGLALAYVRLAEGLQGSGLQVGALCVLQFLLSFASGTATMSHLHHEQAIPYNQRLGTIEKAFFLAGILTLLILLLPETAAVAATALTLPLSVLLSLFVVDDEKELRNVESRSIQADFHIDTRILLAMAACSVGCGFCIVSTVHVSLPICGTVASALLACGAFGILVITRRIKAVNLLSTMAFALPGTTLALLLLCGIAGNLPGWSLVAAFVTFQLLTCVSIVDLLRISEQFEQNPFLYLPLARTYTVAGLAIGALLGLALSLLPNFVAPVSIVPFVAGLLVVLCSITAGIMLTAMGVPLYGGIIFTTQEGHTFTNAKQLQGRRSTPDEIAVDLASEYGLTAREREVLVLLAQGRSAPAIAEQLVISESTAKVHTANIFKKMGIHSRQELIARVNRTR